VTFFDFCDRHMVFVWFATLGAFLIVYDTGAHLYNAHRNKMLARIAEAGELGKVSDNA